MWLLYSFILVGGSSHSLMSVDLVDVAFDVADVLHTIDEDVVPGHTHGAAETSSALEAKQRLSNQAAS